MPRHKSKKGSSIYQALGKAAKRSKGREASRPVSQLGRFVRNMRQEKKLKGVDLCKRAGDLDPRTLTALEKGRIKNPTLKTALSLARGLGISLTDFFCESQLDPASQIYLGSQKGAYQIDFGQPGIKVTSFTPFTEDFFCGKFIFGPKKRISESFLRHEAPIYASVLVGKIEVKVAEKQYLLKEGENIYFPGKLKHSFTNPLQRDCILMLISAPSFFKSR